MKEVSSFPVFQEVLEATCVRPSLLQTLRVDNHGVKIGPPQRLHSRRQVGDEDRNFSGFERSALF